MMEIQSSGWRKRTILFLISQSVTLFGSTLVQMAIAWYVTLYTTSGTWVAAFTICSYLPQFLISFAGGAWADRYSRKKLILLADGIIALATLILIVVMPYLSAMPTLLGAILAISVIRSLGAGIQMPAVNAILPQLVPEQHLMRYNGINATMQSIMQFVAPAAAGAILTFSTLQTTLWVDIITAVIGVGILDCVRIPPSPMPAEKTPILADMKRGIRYAFSNQFIGKLLIIYGLFIFLCVPAGFLAQLLVSRVYGDTYWYLTAMELVGFAGMTAGGLMMGIWGGFKNRTKTLLAGIAAFGALAVGMGISQVFILYLILMLFYGVMLTIVQTATTTLIQERTDVSVQGRIFGLMGSMYSGFLPIGMMVFGPLADVVPLQWIMVGSGVGLVIIAVVMRLNRNFYVNPNRK